MQKWLFLSLDVSQNLKRVSWVHFCQWMQMVLEWSQNLVGGLEQAYRNGSNDSGLFEPRPYSKVRVLAIFNKTENHMLAVVHVDGGGETV